MNDFSSRTERYLARVAAHLPTLDGVPRRREFISQEMEKWEQRYTRFMETRGISHRRGDSRNQPSAFDFVETLAALEIMLANDQPGPAA